MNTFGKRTPVCFEKGNGIFLYDTEGNTYRDYLGGIAVNCLGHSHPKFVKALKDQVENLIHVSNLYYIKEQSKLDKMLIENSAFDKVFYGNSGAEANEGAIKLARKYHYMKDSDKPKIITLSKSFHGRTMMTLSLTGQEKYQKPFKPIFENISHCEANNIDMFDSMVDNKTGIVVMELIQGEGGVNFMDIDFVKHVRNVCSNKDIVLIFDEIQTGIGRTGKLFAYENFQVEPDIITLAKALGGGVPIGAVLCKEKFSAFEVGDHGTSFWVNPLSWKAASIVLDIIESENLIENSKSMGIYAIEKLSKIKDKYSIIKDIRGMGLMIGIEFIDSISKDIYNEFFKRKILIGTAGPNVIRILPPLNISKEDIDIFIEILETILKGQ